MPGWRHTSGDLLIIHYSTVVRSTVKSTDMRVRHMPVVTPRSQISSFECKGGQSRHCQPKRILATKSRQHWPGLLVPPTCSHVPKNQKETKRHPAGQYVGSLPWVRPDRPTFTFSFLSSLPWRVIICWLKMWEKTIAGLSDPALGWEGAQDLEWWARVSKTKLAQGPFPVPPHCHPSALEWRGSCFPPVVRYHLAWREISLEAWWILCSLFLKYCVHTSPGILILFARGLPFYVPSRGMQGWGWAAKAAGGSKTENLRTCVKGWCSLINLMV